MKNNNKTNKLRDFYKYRIVKYNNEYWYFNDCYYCSKQCNLVRIEEKLSIYEGVNLDKISIVRDEVIRQTQLTLFNLFLLIDNRYYEDDYLPKANIEYYIEYVNKEGDVKRGIVKYNTIDTLTKELIISDGYCLNTIDNKFDEVHIPINKIQTLCNKNIKESTVDDNTEDSMNVFDYAKDDIVLTNDNQYCVFIGYTNKGYKECYVHTIMNSIDEKKIKVSDIKCKVTDNFDIISYRMIYNMKLYLNRCKYCFNYSYLPEQNKYYWIRFFNKQSNRIEERYVYGLKRVNYTNCMLSNFSFDTNTGEYTDTLLFEINNLLYIKKVDVLLMPKFLSNFDKVLNLKAGNCENVLYNGKSYLFMDWITDNKAKCVIYNKLNGYQVVSPYLLTTENKA